MEANIFIQSYPLLYKLSVDTYFIIVNFAYLKLGALAHSRQKQAAFVAQWDNRKNIDVNLATVFSKPKRSNTSANNALKIILPIGFEPYDKAFNHLRNRPEKKKDL